MADQTFQIHGLDELLATFAAISDETRYKGGRFALRKGANLLADRAKAAATALDDPNTSNSIAKNIAVRWNNRQFKRTGNLGFRVGVLGGAKQYTASKANVRRGRAGKTFAVGGSKGNPGGDTFYWRFLEFGTKKIKRRDFLAPVLERNQQAVIEVFVNQYGRAIDRALRKKK